MADCKAFFCPIVASELLSDGDSVGDATSVVGSGVSSGVSGSGVSVTESFGAVEGESESLLLEPNNDTKRHNKILWK